MPVLFSPVSEITFVQAMTPSQQIQTGRPQDADVSSFDGREGRHIEKITDLSMPASSMHWMI